MRVLFFVVLIIITLLSRPHSVQSEKYDDNCDGQYATNMCLGRCPYQDDILLGYDYKTKTSICEGPDGSVINQRLFEKETK